MAVFENDRLLAEAAHVGGRSTPLFRLMEDLLARAGLSPADITTLAVGLGPGSYTGIRSAISVAQGWALARPVRLLGVPSSEACAWEARRHGRTGRLGVVIDALRGEFYAAEYDLGGGPEPVVPLHLDPMAALAARAAEGLTWVGPELPLPGLPGDRVMPTARAVAELARRQPADRASARLEPVYLRATTFVKAPPPRAGLPA